MQRGEIEQRVVEGRLFEIEEAIAPLVNRVLAGQGSSLVIARYGSVGARAPNMAFDVVLHAQRLRKVRMCLDTAP